MVGFLSDDGLLAAQNVDPVTIEKCEQTNGKLDRVDLLAGECIHVHVDRRRSKEVLRRNTYKYSSRKKR